MRAWKAFPIGNGLTAAKRLYLNYLLADMNFVRLTLTALDYLLAWPNTYTLDGVLAPAALKLSENSVSGHLSVVICLRRAVTEHLHQRIAEPLAPPSDWRRDSQFKCTCNDCTQLRQFLEDPNQASWQFKAAEDKRQHVSQSISTGFCDVDQKTLKNNRPYTLVCTKNQASYQKRVAQREKDLQMLARLDIDGQ